MEQKLDRRIQRTRGLLREALLALIIERGYDPLIIQDITDRANLRRATFYMHYKDKEELLLSALKEIFDQLVVETEHVSSGDFLGGKTRSAAFLVTFKHAEQNSALYRNILGSGSGAIFARHIRAYLARLIETGMRKAPQPPEIPIEVVANYIAGVELAMVTWWLENEMPYSAERMAEMVHGLVIHGVEDVTNVSLTVT